MQSKPHNCKCCDELIPKDIAALNVKLFERETKRGDYFCLSCMAGYLECEESDLLAKIEQFKSEGCKLFQ